MAEVARIPEWTLGERLAKARRDAGLSQEDMAEHFGLSESAIAKWESDANQPRRFYDRINTWAQVTGVSVMWLINVSDGGTMGSRCTPETLGADAFGDDLVAVGA